MITSSLREVNSVNYKECFAILKESAVFDFRSFQLTSSMVNLSVSSLLRNQQLCKHNLAHNYVFIVLFVFNDVYSAVKENKQDYENIIMS